ncbi:hypothetical protein GCM10010116_08140 [Microbispora rosea subsp. aerata]|nr:DUF1707 and DUF4870 domain-containing protein [Microbispora rosea]GGO04124.1 hypothetical protein GCM10010116_08140 [Microbispora rosea subsp. aerata]GIH54945.1 hypothetical protein Mro02_18590 [Microbispora rosea subsp. aerata]GLJ82959.1 hypothetical protein GCM10017588_16850 [Microbispora rosea subsp. aerata]
MPHPQLRVTDQDREQVVEHVKAAYAEGRLDKQGMDERLHRAMTARTHADLMPIMDDLYGTRPAYVPQPPSYHAAAVPDGGDRVGGAASHLSALLGLFIIGPLLMMVTAGRTSPYIRKHAVESLNFHLTVLGATVLLPFTVVGVVLLPVIWVAGLVLSVVGGVSALAATEFRYPLTIRLIK